MKVNVTTLDNKAGEEITLNKDIFGADTERLDIVHRVVNWQRAKKQAGTHETKERGEIRGGKKKPFKQKGTGNARQGSKNAPHMRGGGIAHGPRARSHAVALPKKVRQLGLKTALSIKAKEGKIRVVDTLVVKDTKTKAVAGKLNKLGVKSALFVRGDNAKDEFNKAVRNIPHMDVIPDIGLNVFDILKHDEVVFTTHSLKNLEERLA